MKSKHTACPHPKCNSSDAYAVYEDGHGYCFSCGSYDKEAPFDFATLVPIMSSKVKDSISFSKGITTQTFPHRGLTRETLQKFNVTTEVYDGKPLRDRFNYPEGSKFRNLDLENSVQKYSSRGNTNSLFGMDIFPAGSAESITITEGEYDAMSVHQIMGRLYPAVSIPSATRLSLFENENIYNYLNSFKKIYLCLDNDEPGRKARDKICEVFGYGKIYIVNLTTYKDANEFLINYKNSEFQAIWRNAPRYRPENILSTWDDFRKALKDKHSVQSIPYPFPTLQAKTLGIRKGELVLIKALEGIGKTEFFRAIEFPILRDTDANVGIIHLEEDKARVLEGIANYELHRPCHLGEITQEEVEKAYQRVIREEDRLFIYSHFGSDDPNDIANIIRYLVVVCKCEYLFLDHLTMVVSGLGDQKERENLDYLSTKLRTLTNDLGFSMHIISHVNDDGKTRGSRNPAKVANTVLSLSRDIQAENEIEKNTLYLNLEKNRFAGQTGPAGRLTFNPETFMLEERSAPEDIPF